MPKQYTLDIPEIAQPKRKVSPASQKDQPQASDGEPAADQA
jgi:hypothetical protein